MSNYPATLDSAHVIYLQAQNVPAPRRMREELVRNVICALYLSELAPSPPLPNRTNLFWVP